MGARNQGARGGGGTWGVGLGGAYLGTGLTSERAVPGGGARWRRGRLSSGRFRGGAGGAMPEPMWAWPLGSSPARPAPSCRQRSEEEQWRPQLQRRERPEDAVRVRWAKGDAGRGGRNDQQVRLRWP